MGHAIPQLMVISGNAATVIILLLMLIACVLFVISLINFYKASRTKLRAHYSRAFRFSGNGFLLLGILQVALLCFVDASVRTNATCAALFFIVFGAAASFVGEKLKPKVNGRK